MILVVLCIGCANAEDMQENTEVTGLVRIIGMSPLGIPQFSKCEAKLVKELVLTSGAKAAVFAPVLDNQQHGILLLCIQDGNYEFLAASATDKEPAFFQDLQVSSPMADDVRLLEKAGQLTMATGVPLVCPVNTTLGTTPVDINGVSSCFAGLFHYLQYAHGFPLLGHLGYYRNPSYTDVKLVESTQPPPGGQSEAHSGTQSTPAKAWRPFEEEYNEKVKQWGEQNPGADPRSREASAAVRQLAVQIRRQRLLEPLNAIERIEQMSLEERELEKYTHGLSQGQRDALLLQLDYLGSVSENPAKTINDFFLTRGLQCKAHLEDVKTLSTDGTPTVVWYKPGATCLLLGKLLINKAAFAVVYAPDTGSTKETTLADIRKEFGDPNDKVDINAIKDEERKRKLLLLQTERKKSIVHLDEQSEYPDQWSKGVFLVSWQAIGHWKALVIEDVRPASNWGPAKVDAKENQNAK
jgi:hypothetical protein